MSEINTEMHSKLVIHNHFLAKGIQDEIQWSYGTGFTKTKQNQKKKEKKKQQKKKTKNKNKQIK